jgi:hypothetical protein
MERRKAMEISVTLLASIFVLGVLLVCLLGPLRKRSKTIEKINKIKRELTEKGDYDTLRDIQRIEAGTPAWLIMEEKEKSHAGQN